MPQNSTLDDLRARVDQSAYHVKGVDDDIKSLYPLTDTLLQHPNPEKYAKLVEAIEEIVKTWQVVDTAFKQVFVLFKPNGDLHDALPGLLDVEAAQLRAIVQEGRGHCHHIGEIYWVDLKDWGSTVLAAEEQQTLDRVFDRLGNADLDVFRVMEELAAETGSVASQIVVLVMNGQQDEARKIAKGLYEIVTPLRQQITVSLSELKQFQSQFADLAPDEASPSPKIVVGEGGVYVEGDFIDGDQISVGDITDSEGIAIGSGAAASVGMEELEEMPMEAEPDMTIVEPPDLDIEYVAMGGTEVPSREDAIYELMDEPGEKGIVMPAEPSAVEPQSPEPVWQTRRVDLAMPATAKVDETTELRALIALLNSEGLRKHLPDFTEGGAIIRDDDVRDDAQVDLQFPADNRPLIIYMRPEPNADDFAVITKPRRIVLFPDRDSNQLTFLLRPLRALGTAYIPVELYADDACTEPLGSAGTATTVVVAESAGDAIRTTAVSLTEPKPQITYVINGGTVTFGDVTTVGNISGSSGIAIGTQATVTIHHLFEPLQAVASELPTAENRATVEQKIDALQQEVEKGDSADDQTMADLISDIAEAAPTAVESIVDLFTDSIIAKAAGVATKFVLGRLQK